MAAAKAAPGTGTAGAAPGRWEVVRKGRRGPAGGAGSRRALGEANAGRALPVPAPIATSSTIFQLGFERALRKQNKEQVPPAAAPEPPQRKQHGGKSGKKAPGSDGGTAPGRSRSLEEALKALDLAELQKELQKSRSVFPENPSVWVKDLAGYLNYKLQAPRSDPVLSQHPHDYPYCLVGKELRNIIRSLLAKASDVLELFFDHCIYTMLQELDKAQGESLHGYRICIQALLLYRPRIATTNLGKYLEVLRSQQNRPAKCLTVLWALGQAGFTDLHEGLKGESQCGIPSWDWQHPPLVLLRAGEGLGRILRSLWLQPCCRQEQGSQGWVVLLCWSSPCQEPAVTVTGPCPPPVQELLCKMRGRGLPWARLLLVLLLLAAGFLLHDVHTHGSFQASSCARLLRSSGVLPASQLAWQKVSRASLQGYRCVTPLGASWGWDGALGQPTRAGQGAGTMGVSQVCSPHTPCAPQLQSRLPEALLHLAECARELLHFLLHSCLLPLLQGLAALLQRGWQRCLDSCSGDVTWQCVREHLMSFTYSSWLYVQDATLALKDWALAMISGR
uniref:Transmembrane protein 214 n=1 Tax=Junco hyemalis TaxID=40217 RepID=A0A8C5J0G2_JUNHY